MAEQQQPTEKSKNNNGLIITLIVLVVVAIGLIAYLSLQINMQGEGAGTEAVASDGNGRNGASGSDRAAGQADDETPSDQENRQIAAAIDPGNPVVAEVGDQEIRRMDVFNFIRNLPEESRAQPIQQLYPLALEEVLKARIVAEKADEADMSDNAAVQEQLEEVKRQIMRNVYIQQEVDRRLTEERLREAYALYTDNFPDVTEVRARHILVETEEEAQNLIDRLQEGADFAALAREHSNDATAAQGGDLGYFLRNDVVPQFGEAAFNLEEGAVTQEPVQSDFGYHVIKVLDKRQREPASFEQAKEFLRPSLRQAILNGLISEWRQDVSIRLYDINGNQPELVSGQPVLVPSTAEPDENAENNAQAQERPDTENPEGSAEQNEAASGEGETNQDPAASPAE